MLWVVTRRVFPSPMKETLWLPGEVRVRNVQNGACWEREGAEGNLTTVQLDDLVIELSKASILLSHRRYFVVKNFIP